MVNAKRLRKLLSYDSGSGIFTWIAKGHGIRSGTTAGYIHSRRGYCYIKIDFKKYLAHRLAWLWMTGGWTKHQIDHINGRFSDNRWCNLRDVAPATNRQNIKNHAKNSRTGLLGVIKVRGKFRSGITANGCYIHLGTFDTPDQAAAAHLAAKRKYHAGCTI